MFEFFCKLYGEFHLWFLEVPMQLVAWIFGKATLSFRFIDGHIIAIVKCKKGKLSTNKRCDNSPALTVYTFSGGIIYAEEDVPEGAVLHEIGHIVVPAARVALHPAMNLVAMHGNLSSPEELAADDFAVSNGYGPMLREFLVDMREQSILGNMKLRGCGREEAESIVDGTMDLALRIKRLS